MVEDATPVYDRLGRELQLVSHTLDIIDDLLPMDVQWYKRRASQRHFPIDLCLNAQKEPWFAERLAAHIDATSGSFDEVRLAYVQTISDLHGVKLEDLGSAQVERSILSRQRGLIWLGAKVAARCLGFISTETPSSEGEHLEWFSANVDLDKNPDKFRNFWERCEAFARDHEFDKINSPKTLLAFCSAFCEFTKGIFSSEDYIPTHLTRKLWLRIEGELRQKQCDQEPDPWAQFWSQTTMRELERCFPDQKHFLAPFGRNCRVSEVSARFNGQHVLLISCWACLMRDAVNTSGAERCTELFKHDPPKVK